MTDDIRPDSQATDAGSATAVASPPGSDAPKKLRQEVEIRDTGPCKKHIKVTVNREDIDTRMGEHFHKLAKESNVTGFRPGKAPRRLIEKRFHKEVAGQVKAEVLLASLEQLGEDHDVAPLAQPDIDPEKIEIPLQGPMVYEFEVEVRPHFDLPLYRGLKLKRPVRTLSAEDVVDARRNLLSPHGQIAPKENGKAESGDIVIADMTVRNGEQVVGTLKEVQLRVQRNLAFKDAMIRNFSKQIQDARAGDTRVMDMQTTSSAAGNQGSLTLKATIEVKDVKLVREPELTAEYVKENFGLHSADQLDEALRVMLERNLEYQQRESARQQVLSLIDQASKWDLPEEFLKRHYRQTRNRRIMEMKSDGLAEAEIARRIRLMDQDLLKETALSLKEHFVLQKIAEVEKIEVDERDVEDEIQRMAEQSDESPRRLRARLEKEEMLEALMAQLIERKALDLILDSAEYEDVPLDRDSEVHSDLATVEAQAVAGEMRDPSAPSETQPQEGSNP